GEASIGGISPVGGFPRGISALGLEEMGGNVWEWCRDHCDVDTKTDTYVDDIPDPLCARGSYRVVRGGAWYFPSYFCRAVSRRGSHPAVRFDYVGFRLALQVKQAG
ncbi:MAG: formylglycine-generating enzyme family protein, partial [Desulfovibrionales bacterium]|nr:formylglycine-generating enzyme family protein [Desulfovibrionales bacterium]